MVGVNSSYCAFQNDVVFCFRVSKCRRFTVYPYSVVFPSRRLHPPVHVYQSNGSYFMFSLLLMSSSRYIFYFIVSLPIFSLPLFPFQTSALLPFCCAGFFLKIFTGLLLKASGFLCTGLPVVQLHRSLAESVWYSLYRFAKNETILYAFLYAYPSSRCNVFSVCFSKLHRSLAESLWFSLYSFTGLLLKAFGILSTGLRKMKLYSMPLSTHILLISLWRKLIRKICVEKSMKLSSVSFPGISLEDSLSILGTNILSFSRGDRSLAETIWFSLYSFPEDAMFFLLLFQAFGIFYLCSASFRFCSTGLLLKPSGFLYMRTETMSLSDVSFPGISLEDSPRITFVAEHETDILNGLLMVSVLPLATLPSETTSFLGIRVSKPCRFDIHPCSIFSLLEGCIRPYTCSNRTALISYLVFFLCLLHAIYCILLSRFLFILYLCVLFKPPLYSRFVVHVFSSTCNVE
ncbi:hypothetical protein LXL04_003584 [Taraxacum kok-saghyz]